MTDQQINLAIAEYCGWTNCRYLHTLRDTNGIPPENWKGKLITGLDLAWIPNYCNDLNAMHEAVSALSRSQYVKWCNTLEKLGDGDDYYNATARQRAEAFMQTIGKWEEARK